MFNYDRKIIPKNLNPILSQELKDEVNFFLKWGYLIVNNALNEKEVSTIRAAFDDTLNDENKLNHIELSPQYYLQRMFCHLALRLNLDILVCRIYLWV